MARFISFISHISVLLVVWLVLTIRINSISSSSPSLSLAPSPSDPDVNHVSTEYHSPSFGSPSPAETEYDSLSPPVYPPSGLSHSVKSPLLDTDGFGQATILAMTISQSPEQPPLTSPRPSTPVGAPSLTTPSAWPPSLPLTDEKVESSPAPPSEYEEGSEASLWLDQQIMSSMPYESSSSNRGDDDSVVYEQKPKKQPEVEKEDSGERNAGKGGVGFGVAMGVCMVGLGGLVYMKMRRKENDVRRTRKYVQLAERESLLLGFPSIQRV